MSSQFDHNKTITIWVGLRLFLMSKDVKGLEMYTHTKLRKKTGIIGSQQKPTEVLLVRYYSLLQKPDQKLRKEEKVMKVC